MYKYSKCYTQILTSCLKTMEPKMCMCELYRMNMHTQKDYNMNTTTKSLVNLIHGCNNHRSFKQIHAHLITSNTTIEDNFLMVNKVIDFFKYSNELDYASKFLINHTHFTTNSFPSNSLIAAHAGSKTPESAVLVYKKLVSNGFSPDMYTFPVVLKSCVKLLRAGEGKQVHGVVVKVGFFDDLFVQNGLLHLYSGCGECGDASKLFDEMPVKDVVSWSSLISGYVKAAHFNKAVFLFAKMDVEPNAVTIASGLVACGRVGNRGMGKGIHCLIIKRDIEVGGTMGNALVDMYVKLMCLDEAKQVFHEIPDRDAVTWTSIISGLVQCKQSKEALEFFHAMQDSGIEPDKVTLASVLSACTGLGAIEYGKWIHEYIDRKGIERDPHIGTALVDMYAKCGSIEMAACTFHAMPHKNLSTWNALLGGLAMHGHGKEALDEFKEMLKIGMMPNAVTFVAVLSACCHSGLVDEGRWYFHEMSQVYNLTPTVEHYGCMADLLCRAGHLREAQELVKSMPMAPDVLICGALLSACKAHGDVETSQNILDHLLELESDDSGVYVLLSNIFASNNRWEDVTRVRNLMKEKGIKKFPGSSLIEVGGKTHEFLVGGGTDCHPQQEEIYFVLNILTKQAFLEEEII